jgi:Carboxypeptidase regulatory-like domain/Secretion system C-terminal sorting domain
VIRRAPPATIAPPGVFAFLLVLLAPGVCLAGAICGTVRDSQTLQPVSRAAVFLFDNLDQYTGRYAGTDVAGHYCIDNVPNGTYTLQVRVDDYLAAVVRGIVVNEATSVDVTARPPLFLNQPWPNPATSDVVFELDAPDGAATTLEVYDVRGRLVMGWRGDAPSGTQTIRWNLRDPGGEPVASGIYLVRLRSGGNEAIRRFVRLR